MKIALAKDDGSGDAPKPGPVPKEALDFFRKKKLKPSFKYTDVWQQEHTFAFTVAKITERGILKTVRDSIESAIADGKTLEDWKKEITPTLQQSGWKKHVTDANEPSRLRTIFETNMRMARAHGQHERIQRTKKILPFLKWELGPSKEHNPQHVEWSKMQPLPVDDPSWKYRTPPCKWGCKCHLRQISRRETDKLGGPGESPDLVMVPFDIDGRKGEAPEGVDPEFSYPKDGAGREESLNDALQGAE